MTLNLCLVDLPVTIRCNASTILVELNAFQTSVLGLHLLLHQGGIQVAKTTCKPCTLSSICALEWKPMYIHDNTMNDAFWNKSRGSFLSAGCAMISDRLIPMHLATHVLNLGIDSCASLSHTLSMPLPFCTSP